MNYYDLLGVSKSANSTDIKDAYLQLAKKYHPDVNDAKNANYLFVQIKDAYEILSNPEQREKYDQDIRYRKSTYKGNDYYQAWSEKNKTHEKSNEREERKRESSSSSKDRSTYNDKSKESKDSYSSTHTENHNKTEYDSNYNSSWGFGKTFITIILFSVIIYFFSIQNPTLIESSQSVSATKSDEDIAIEIVKESDWINLDSLIKSNPRVYNNHEWYAKKYKGYIYFVTFSYPNRELHYEVNINVKTVKRIDGSSVLEKRYKENGFLD